MDRESSEPEIRRRGRRPALSTRGMERQMATNWARPAIMEARLLSILDPAASKMSTVLKTRTYTPDHIWKNMRHMERKIGWRDWREKNTLKRDWLVPESEVPIAALAAMNALVSSTSNLKIVDDLGISYEYAVVAVPTLPVPSQTFGTREKSQLHFFLCC